MQEVARLTFNPQAVRAGTALPPGDPLAPLLARAAEVFDEALKAKVADCTECTVVYHGCGSCEHGGALVEYYCTSGGSAPDYRTCESCG